MTILYEYRRSAKRRGPPILVTEQGITGSQGFRSMYGFDDEVAGDINEKKGTWGLGQHRLYADVVYIDIDDRPEDIEKTKNKLIKMGLGFSMYMSGSPDSAHFHIPCTEQHITGLNRLHLQWVKDNFKGFDNIYKPSGIIRITGTYHKSYPGERKHEVFRNEGKLLDLHDYKMQVTYEMPSFKFVQENADEDRLEIIFDQMLMTHIGEGARNDALYKMIALAKDIGKSADEALDTVDIYNSIMVCPPLNSKRVHEMVRSVYRDCI